MKILEFLILKYLKNETTTIYNLLLFRKIVAIPLINTLHYILSTFS